MTQLAHTIARRVGRLLEREGLLERDNEQLDLGDALDEEDPMPAKPASATNSSGCADTSAVRPSRKRACS